MTEEGTSPETNQEATSSTPETTTEATATDVASTEQPQSEDAKAPEATETAVEEAKEVAEPTPEATDVAKEETPPVAEAAAVEPPAKFIKTITLKNNITESQTVLTSTNEFGLAFQNVDGNNTEIFQLGSNDMLDKSGVVIAVYCGHSIINVEYATV